MNLRKEQVLLLVVLVLGLWSYSSMRGGEERRFRFSAKRLDYSGVELGDPGLAEALTPAVPVRNWTREPSETSPLPPRELEFPATAPMRIVALPLDPGPDFHWSQALAMSGEIVPDPAAPGAGQPAGAPPEGQGRPAEDPSAPAAQEPTAAERKARFDRLYDRVWNAANMREPLYGIVEYPGGDRFDLEDPNFDFSDKEIWLRRFSLKDEKVLGRDRLDGKSIHRIRLAESLRNDVEREKRKVPADMGHLPERSRLIHWLLDKAREDASIYDDALEQAEAYFAQSKDLNGLRLMAAVLRARGDLERDLKLYRELPERFRGSAFQYEGLGRIEEWLGLEADAERDLRAAVAAEPLDPGPRVALAGFLRRHARPLPALAEAMRAEQAIGVLTDEEDIRSAVREIVACYLAVGRVEEARSILQRNGDFSPYLTGCIEYAAGNLEAALEAFRGAGSTPEALHAVLGAGAAALRAGDLASARSSFETVVDQAPLLRHRAYAGLALLSLRAGQRDQALSYLDRALEAAPGDIYALYLRGRALREAGELSMALDLSDEVLRRRDDFVYAVAERAALHVDLASSSADLERAQNFLSAVRYVDRAVALAEPATLDLVEMQARLHFLAADTRGAEAAFARAREMASTDQQKLYGRAGQALCDYRRGRVDEARDQLQRMISDLPRDDGMRKWAEQRLAEIDDHSQKEKLDDRFERSDLGSVWVASGQLRPAIRGNALVFRGRLSRSEELSVARAGAVKKAGKFLAVGVTMTLGTANFAQDQSAGLRIRTGRGGAQLFEAWIGVRDGAPYLRVVDGREEPVQQKPEILAFDAGKPQVLRMEVVPRDGQGRQFALRCFWNGVPVYEHPKLTNLHANSTGELATSLFVSGSQGGSVDVVFDDYHLERRKDGP
ncbi:MAG: hypothetical protein Fur0037_02160 [Planctomycetota bacterium]